ncbi:MAG: hypothetical protein VB089_07895 [Anaerolineaceae bacterium]|nr:hypothetical protein [Anaerolineaceae bacterium]
MIWFADKLGIPGILEVLSTDRPFLAGVYILTTSVLQSIPYQWQILALLSRWLTGIAVWWSLLQLWPQHRRQITWIAILFTLYPGFKQQPISVVYGNGFILYAMYIFSLGLMLLAIRRPARYWWYTLLGLASYAFCTFSTEYYVGLDLLRPVLILILLSESIPDWRTRLVQTLKHWLPYLVVLAAFLFWRVFIFKFPTYQPVLVEQATTSPLTLLFHLANRILQDSFLSGWLAWAEVFRFPNLEDLRVLNQALYWALVAVSLPLVWFYLHRLAPGAQDADTPHTTYFSGQLILLGIFTLLIAGWPFWITDLPIKLEYPWDRFNLAFMLGSSFLIVGLIDWLLRVPVQKITLLTLVIALSIGAHFQNSNTYRREWDLQKEMFWQLVWRAPELKPGTLLMTNKLPFAYYSDNSLTAPLNWTYAPDFHSTDIPYYLAFTEVRLGRSIQAYEENLPVQQAYRTTSFNSTTSSGLAFQFQPPGCVRILDPAIDRENPAIHSELQSAMVISHLGQIVVDPAGPARPPQAIFGDEPAHTWCYYYERADLARQQGDWSEAARLGDEAFGNGYAPQEPSELILFAEAYMHIGEVQHAGSLYAQAIHTSNALQSEVCRSIKRSVQSINDPEKFDIVAAYSNELQCTLD